MSPRSATRSWGAYRGSSQRGLRWGWEWAFILTGAVGLLWLAFWYKMYASPAAKLASGQLTQAEYDYIHSDRDEQAAEKADAAGARISGAKLIGFRQTWAFVIGKFMTDPIWWFFLFWLPAYLKAQYGMTGTQIAVPIAVR